MAKILLLPGLDGTGLLFAPLIGALDGAMECQIISYPSDPLRYGSLERWVRSQLPSKEPYILLGESFSGPLVLTLAANPPSGLVGLVLSCSFSRYPLPLARFFSWLCPLIPFALLPRRILASFLLGHGCTPSQRASFYSAIACVPAGTLRMRLKEVLAVDCSTSLGAISLPLLYLQAEHDRVVPREAGRHIVRCHPATKLIRLPAPHLLLQTIPGQAAALIQEFARTDCHLL